MKLFTVQEAADQLTLSVASVKKLLRRGRIPFVDVSVKEGSAKPRRRICEADLMAFIESRRVQPSVAHGIRRRRRKGGQA